MTTEHIRKCRKLEAYILKKFTKLCYPNSSHITIKKSYRKDGFTRLYTGLTNIREYETIQTKLNSIFSNNELNIKIDKQVMKDGRNRKFVTNYLQIDINKTDLTLIEGILKIKNV